MTDRNVFIYWNGVDYKLIKILRDLIYLHSNNGVGYKIHFLNRDSIKDYISVPSYFDSLCYAHQADYVRVNVICDFGGIWLDSDTLVMGSLDSLFDIIDDKDGFFLKENNTILFNGVFGSKKNTNLMLNWKNNLLSILDHKKNTIEWTEVGNTMLDNFEKNTSLLENYTIFQGLDSMYPVNWDLCVSEFLDKEYDNYKNLVRDYQPLIVLVNSVYKKYESILDVDNIPLSYFLEKSKKSI